jgi:AraC-like DNA-binding protein
LSDYQKSDFSILTSLVLLILRGLNKYDQDPLSLLRQVGLNPDLISQPEARYPVDRIQLLWQRAVEITGEEAFGILVMKEIQPAALQGLGFSWLSSDTLKDAIQRLIRYIRFISTAAQLDFYEKGNEYHLVFDFVPGAYKKPPLPVSVDAGVALIVQMCRLSAAPDFVPSRVDLCRKAPKNLSPFKQFFKTTVNFSAKRNALVFTREQIEKPLEFSNPELARANDETVIRYLVSFDQENISCKVRAKIIDLMPMGVPKQKDIAHSLHLSLRSMQRLLKKENTNYRIIVNDIRVDLAHQYLKSMSYSIGQVAYMLGYSEPSSFIRAFKRSTGILPSKLATQE